MSLTGRFAVIIHADALAGLARCADNSAQCCVTSPPYFGLRDYGVQGQIGLEATPEAYISRLVAIFREVWRVLKNDGILWINIGDSYAGSGKGGQSEDKRSSSWQPVYPNKNATYGLKPKDMIGIPWLLALALRADGWYLRQDIIWHKPNCLPESVKDRCTRAHEYIFLLSKSEKYYFNHRAIMEIADYDGRHDTRMKGSHKYSAEGIHYNNGPQSFAARGHERWQRDEFGRFLRNKRDVWTIMTQPYHNAHFATFPPELIRPCVLAGSRPRDTIIDPFFGAGTTGVVAVEEGREYIGIDINSDYCELAKKRLSNVAQQLLLFSGGVENGDYEKSTDNEQCEEKGLAVSGQGLPDECKGRVYG